MTNRKFTLERGQMIDKIKELIRQGNIGRVHLIHKERPLMDIPLTVGVPIAAATVLSAPSPGLGAIAALVTECTIEMERVEDIQEETGGKTIASESLPVS